MTKNQRREQLRKIQRAVDDYYSNRPTIRDELVAACHNAFELLIEKEGQGGE